jgi:hypothetical protein
MGHEELKNQINALKTDYSRKRFNERVRFTLNVPLGNLLEVAATIAVAVMVLLIDSEWMLYISALALMTTLHPLAHYLTGVLSGIRFTHYYLN